MKRKKYLKTIVLTMCFAACFVIIAAVSAAVVKGGQGGISLPTITFGPDPTGHSSGGFYGDDDYFLLGDINSDEKVDEKDAEYFLMYLYFPEDYPVEKQKLDFDNNGFVNDADVAYFLCYLGDNEAFPISESTAYESDESGG